MSYLVKNIEQERKKKVKEIEEEYSTENFHEFTPNRLYNFLRPICDLDALRLLQMLIRRAQIGENFVTKKMFFKRYGKFPSMYSIKNLMHVGLIEELVTGAYSVTMKVNEYAEILAMMRVGDNPPEIHQIDNHDYYRIEMTYQPIYQVVSKQGRVMKKSLSKRELQRYINELIDKKYKSKIIDTETLTDEEIDDITL